LGIALIVAFLVLSFNFLEVSESKPVLDPTLCPVGFVCKEQASRSAERDNEPVPRTLFIAIISGPGDFGQRQALRNSWIMKSPENDSLVSAPGYKFYVGETFDQNVISGIAKENEQYNDIIILPLYDSYLNLTLKTRLVFEHAFANYSFDFLLKADDDIFVCLNDLVGALRNLPSKDDYYIGHFLLTGKPVRDPASKWYVSEREYPGDFYPAYCDGPAYVLSRNLVEYLAPLRPALKMEDVSVGISLTERGKPVNRGDYLLRQDTWWERNCYTTIRFVPHRVPETGKWDFWTECCVAPKWLNFTIVQEYVPKMVVPTTA